MKDRDKQLLALRMAYLSGIFSLIICLVMLLNYRQLVSTDPLESELMKTMVERLQDDTSNKELKAEIRKLDLMARNAYFNNQWQIRSGAFLLIGGIIIMVISLRMYYSFKAKVPVPESKEAKLDIELLISRKWILYSVAIIFGLALTASYLSVDHLSDTYAIAEVEEKKDEVPVRQIVSAEEQQSAPVEAVQQTEEVKQQPETVEPDEIKQEPEPEAKVEEVASIPAEPQPEPAKVQAVGNLLDNFPSFRGPYGLGIAHQKDIPTAWDGAAGENVLWKVRIPLPGYNSPVIWNDQVFLTGADKSSQSIYCYDLQTGSLVWEHKVEGIERISAKTIKPTEDTGFAAPTVATDGRHVYAIFATGDLACVDMSGERIWAKNLGTPDNHYGHSSSLLLWKNKLYIQFDTNEAGRILAVDATTGNTAWETSRTSKISWASPILADMGDHHELVLASSPDVAGYDPESGKELWKLSCLSGEVGPSPALLDGVIFASNEYATLIAIKPGNPPEVLWETNEYLPEVASPVGIDDLLYVATSYGVLVCYNAKSGEIIWEYEADAGFYASPMIADDKVYFMDMDGVMHIFAIDKSMKLVGTPALGERSVSSPAFATGKILMRGYDNLYCIGK